MSPLHYDITTQNLDNTRFGEHFLICPSCREKLRRTDIEAYNRCPFCNYHFEMNRQLEDFLLEPAVECWIVKQETIHSGRHDDSL